MTAFGLLTMLMTMLVGVPAASAAGEVTLSTPFPAVAVAPGAKVSFDITVDSSVTQRVDLSIAGTPTGWTTQLIGGGFVVDSVQATASGDPTKVRLDVNVPADATATTARIRVSADAGGTTDTLPLDIRVTPQAAGAVSLTTTTNQLKGPSTASFKFSLTFRNDTSEDLTITGLSSGPPGWTVTTQVSTDAQAANTIVKAGATSPVTVTATAPATVAAGVYPISVEVSGGTRTAQADLAAEVTGTYTLKLTTPDGRLNAQASAGSSTDLSLVLQNTGTAPISGVTTTASAPTGWKVTFEPADGVDVAPGVDQTVIARIIPSNEAIAGDYVVTFRSTSDLANASSDIRVTIQTGLLGGALGIGLIVLVLAGLGWVFLRYGRR